MIKISRDFLPITMVYWMLYIAAVGGAILAVLSLFMLIRGLIKKSKKKTIIIWVIIFISALVLSFLSITGQLITVV